MEITKSQSLAFAYTIKKLNKTNQPPSQGDYDVFFKKLSKFNITVEYKISELDSKGHIHYHGILYLDKGFYRRKLMIKGFHMKLDEIYDKSGWVKYIHKDCKYAHMEQEAKERALLRKSLFN